MIKKFKTFVTSEKSDGTFFNSIQEKTINELPKGDLLINVKYSSLNFKDALSATGNKGVTKKYPHTPGIDAAGIVKNSQDKNFPIGASVIVSGYDLGMNTPGGFSEYIRVPSSWAVLKPETLSLEDSMIIGTAGLTAGLCVRAIQKEHSIRGMNAIVSGATGGVGCIAVKLLSKLGAKVTAITGKPKSHSFLQNLGAQEILDRSEFLNSVKGPIGKGLWDIAIDIVGGSMLSTILASMKYGGITTCCGLVESPIFRSSVFPFILRANQLVGIDSAEAPLNIKKEIWHNFSKKWKLNNLEQISNIVNLNEISLKIKKILTGGQTGRIVLKL